MDGRQAYRHVWSLLAASGLHIDISLISWRSQTYHDRANINIELSIAPFSAGERRKRGRGDK